MINSIHYSEMKRQMGTAHQSAKSDKFKEDLRGKETKNNVRPDLMDQVDTMFTPENKLQFTEEEWKAVQEKAETTTEDALWNSGAAKLNLRV